MKRHIGLSFAVLFVSFAAGLHGGSIVVNGSFEQGTLGIGSFQGWQTNLGDISTFVDSSGVTRPLYGDAFDGLWAAYFGSTATDGGASISQNLATTVGQEYLLTFELADDNGGLPPMNRFTTTVGTATALSLTNSANQDYVKYQFSFLATSNLTPLVFFGSNDNSYLELDNVAVNAVPEPSTISLFVAGALLMLPVARQRVANSRRRDL